MGGGGDHTLRHRAIAARWVRRASLPDRNSDWTGNCRNHVRCTPTGLMTAAPADCDLFAPDQMTGSSVQLFDEKPNE